MGFSSFMETFEGVFPDRLKFAVETDKFGILCPIRDFITKKNLKFWEKSFRQDSPLFTAALDKLRGHEDPVLRIGYYVGGDLISWVQVPNGATPGFRIRMSKEATYSVDHGLQSEASTSLAAIIQLDCPGGSSEQFFFDINTGERITPTVPVSLMLDENDVLKCLNILDQVIVEARAELEKINIELGRAVSTPKKIHLANLITTLMNIRDELLYTRRDQLDLLITYKQITDLAKKLEEFCNGYSS